jgi:hypothetical protein
MAITTINIDSQVLTFANLAAFPLVGTVKTIYIAEDTNFQYYWDGSQYELLGSVGTVTSVGLTMPSAFTVSNSPITSSGDIAVTGAGLANQYVRGDGSLANFPTNGGGGSSVNYYLNGSVNQGTFGGDTYYELSKTPIIGAGTNFTRTNAQGNGYIASFITDAGDPNLLNIPAGNWHLEFYFNANSGGGSPSFYGELYKVSNTNVFTLIASGSTNPEGITQGTTVDQYFTSIPVPQTTLLATDRLAIRVYVNTGGRNITLHTEDNNLCQVITTFSTGLNALNGLTAQVQNLAVGTSGTDFAINSVTDTHTFNLPTASATNRGALSSADWSTFNGKVDTGTITSSGLTMATARLLGRGTAGSGAVEEIVIGSGLTLTGTTLSAAGGGITIGTTAIASGTVGRVLFEGAGNVVQQDSTFVWENTDKRLILGTEAVADTNSRLVVIGKGTSTNTTFAVHNLTGTNNALVVRDDGRVGIGTSSPSGQLHINGAFPSKVGLIINGTNLASNNGSFAVWQNNGVDRGYIYVADAGSDALRGLKISNPTAGSEVFVGTGNRGVVVTNSGSFTTQNAFDPVPTATMGVTTPLTVFGVDVTSGTIGSTISHIHATNTVGRQSQLLHRFRTSINQIAEYGGFGTELMVNTNAAHSGDLFWRTALTGTFAERMRLKASGNLLLGTTSEGASATKTLVINNGTSPTGNVTDSFQQYSADIVAGNAAPHFRTENGNIIKIYRETTAIAAGAFVSNTSLIFDDTATYGGYTMGQVVAALKAQGLLA